MCDVRVAVVGAGLIGKRHVAEAVRHGCLAAIVDPDPSVEGLAQSYNVPWFASLEPMLNRVRPDGVVLASPNQLHAPQAGTLSVPDLRLWRHDDVRSWWQPIAAETLTVTRADAFARQFSHFLNVIAGREAPLVDASEGRKSLSAVLSVLQAALPENPK